MATATIAWLLLLAWLTIGAVVGILFGTLAKERRQRHSTQLARK